MFMFPKVARAVIIMQSHLIEGADRRVEGVVLDEAFAAEHEFGRALVTPLWDFTQEKVLRFADEMRQAC